MLRDILKGDDPEVIATLKLLAEAAPDVVLLAGVDHDARGAAAGALVRALSDEGLHLPHHFAPRPNSGRPSGLDLDGNGRFGEGRDSLGYGRFSGAGGLLLLSRYPIDAGSVQDFTALLWRDLPGAVLPARPDGTPFYPETAQAVLPLSTTGHWSVTLRIDGAPLTVMASYATPPVFDGPEDANGLRNRDELRLWALHLDGALGRPPAEPFVLLLAANLDPDDGDGRGAAMAEFLSRPDLTDPRPASAGGVAAASPGHRGDPALDTADWPEGDGGPGNLRVDYVLPSADLTVAGAGVLWPAPDDPAAALLEQTGAHRLVWVDIALP